MKKDKLGAIRLTEQRKVILEELKQLKTHPTADELYFIVKKILPKISIATVYRNLEALSAAGYIIKIKSAGNQKRFDGNMQEHTHIRCIKCNKVRDIEDKIELPEKYKNLKTDFNIIGFNIDLYGICPNCL
ncbi:MAG: transcriptional repressor [Deltaproteobacteria bacterium]|nr:transcriptional repressor [Deltaproteobacteria bacterium]